MIKLYTYFSSGLGAFLGYLGDFEHVVDLDDAIENYAKQLKVEHPTSLYLTDEGWNIIDSSGHHWPLPPLDAIPSILGARELEDGCCARLNPYGGSEQPDQD